MVISSIVFDFDIVFAAITATFLGVVDQSNSCTLIGWFGSIAVLSVDFVLCNRPTWLVVWHSGRTSVSDRRTFPVLRSTCG